MKLTPRAPRWILALVVAVSTLAGIAGVHSGNLITPGVLHIQSGTANPPAPPNYMIG